MANKSKKRIKHEQYVYIKKLERELKKLRAEAMMYEVAELKFSRFITPHVRDAVRYEQILKMSYEEACHAMAEQLIQIGAVELTKTRALNPTWCADSERHDFTLRVLKRRY